MLKATKVKLESIGTCELKDRNHKKIEIAERQKSLFAYVLLGQQLPPPLAFIRASCLLQSCSILSLLWEDSGFLHQTACKSRNCYLARSKGFFVSVCPPWVPGIVQLVAVPQDRVVWELLVCHGTECSSGLSIALRREHFGLWCVSLRFDRFSFSPLNHWWKSARLEGHVLLFVAGKQNKTR